MEDLRFKSRLLSFGEFSFLILVGVVFALFSTLAFETFEVISKNYLILISWLVLIYFTLVMIFIVKNWKFGIKFKKEKSSLEKKDKRIAGYVVQKNKNKSKEKNSNYLGTSETKTYHLSTCRFSKLIKPKFKLESDDRKFFTSKRYKPCKVCKPNRKIF